MNKKGYSPGFGLFIALAVIFVGAFAFIILNFALTQYITPALETTINQSIGDYGFTAADAALIQALLSRVWR